MLALDCLFMKWVPHRCRRHLIYRFASPWLLDLYNDCYATDCMGGGIRSVYVRSRYDVIFKVDLARGGMTYSLSSTPIMSKSPITCHGAFGMPKASDISEHWCIAQCSILHSASRPQASRLQCRSTIR